MTEVSRLGFAVLNFLNDFNSWGMAHTLESTILHTGGSMDLFRIAMVFFILMLARENAGAQNNDVYNFYFQKGSAPQSVIQGGSGQAASQPLNAPTPLAPVAPPPSPEAMVATSAPAPEAVKKDYNHFELHLGPTRIKDEVGSATAYTVGTQLNFNRYLGARFQGHYLAVESADYERPINDRDQASNRWGGLVAVVFTPLRMDLVGHKLIRIGAMAGARSERRFDEGSSGDVNTKVQAFVGASVGVNLNENVGIEGSVAMVDGGEIGQATGSLVFSF